MKRIDLLMKTGCMIDVDGDEKEVNLSVDEKRSLQGNYNPVLVKSPSQ